MVYDEEWAVCIEGRIEVLEERLARLEHPQDRRLGPRGQSPYDAGRAKDIIKRIKLR